MEITTTTSVQMAITNLFSCISTSTTNLLLFHFDVIIIDSLFIAVFFQEKKKTPNAHVHKTLVIRPN